MIKKLEIYKCPTCGAMIECLNNAGGTLSCCGKPMQVLSETANDGALEKHVPVVECKDNKVIVTVGDVEHPMTSEHFIQWIEVICKDGSTSRKFLNPNEKPYAEFCLDGELDRVREFCNLHGLWKSK